MLDPMVRAQHGHHCVRVAPAQVQRRQPDTRRRAAPRGLDQDVLARHVRQLLSDEVGVGWAGDHIDSIGRNDRQRAIHGLLEHRSLAVNPQKLLGLRVAAVGPETRATSAGKNKCVHWYLRSMISTDTTDWEADLTESA